MQDKAPCPLQRQYISGIVELRRLIQSVTNFFSDFHILPTTSMLRWYAAFDFIVDSLSLHLEWKNDFELQSRGIYNLSNGQQVPGHLMHVTCTHKEGMKPSFSSIFAGFSPAATSQNCNGEHPCEKVAEQKKQDWPTLNVIMLCLDSVSQQAFRRFLPNTTRFLRDKLHATFFEKHTLLGDGTPPGILQ